MPETIAVADRGSIDVVSTRALTDRRVSRRAMTLVEILAVVVMLALMAGTLVTSFHRLFGRAKHELARSGIGVIVSKLELHRIERMRWPSGEVGLAALSEGIADPTDTFFLGADQLVDPWGRAYLYLVPGPDGHPYEVLSRGADGEPGGEGDDADISSVRLRGETD